MSIMFYSTILKDHLLCIMIICLVNMQVVVINIYIRWICLRDLILNLFQRVQMSMLVKQEN